MGDRLVFVAIALYVTEIGTPTDVGVVLAAYTVSLVLCLMFGGVWTERVARHRLMLATDLVRRVVAASARGSVPSHARVMHRTSFWPTVVSPLTPSSR